MTDLFYDASPNATRIVQSNKAGREYPEKPDRVVLFGTCVVDLFFPEAGMDAIRLLEHQGIQVDFPQNQSCCGQPAWTSGYREQAESVARAQLALLDTGTPVVVPSGSCAGMIRHHYPGLFNHEPQTRDRALRVAENTFELTEFLLNVCRVRLQDRGRHRQVALHTSCTARREMQTHHHARGLLAQLSGVTRVDHDHESECCGFGGTFCVRMPDISGAMVADKTQSLSQSGADELISADCGCLLNINGAMNRQNLNLKGRHIASFLWERCQEGS
ncbi:L-lactate dehydrogenase complex protein LldE [Tamilnaduibacter salinus]|uniref:L-lactate dehydrogenase complex protein LldE n=1 Tax=Tamilnaduibacter salinus TaxID=1484056 RepID=A0A2A2HZX1_9GAMM|nr:(Fe-S)-binding protein [Tamilnaduibacter salinus]PAV25291.1 oxidoreductase [Tamilnaduibacter salinus]PVY77013.1 L-lactate dehydrogenase complex protein LldE [Tamilnaduibacter salinus]